MLEQPVRVFLEQIQQIIAANEQIKKLSSGVYLTPIAEPAYPFILIGFNKTIDYQQFQLSQHQIHFDISIIYRHQQSSLPQIASSIEQAMKTAKLALQGCKVLGLQRQESTNINSKDTLTSKFIINYLAFIRVI